VDEHGKNTNAGADRSLQKFSEGPFGGNRKHKNNHGLEGFVLTKWPCLKIPKTSGQKAIEIVRDLEIYSRNFKIEQKDNYLYIPLSQHPTEKERKTLKKTLQNMEICIHDFRALVSKPKGFVDLLAQWLPHHLIASLPRSADFVGDIAVVEIPSELDAYKHKIGETILTTNKRVHTVLAKASAISGVYRTRKFEVIAGEPKTATVHREYGCIFYVDLSKAYFSPRLSSEHARIAKLVDEGETVIDMFAGVGPFSIQIARQHDKVHVYAVDVNSAAIEFLNKNIAANRVLAKVTPVLGDVRKVVHERFVGVADRVIMNLPEKAIEYVDAACKALKPTGGIMHYYAFTGASEPKAATEVRLVEAVEKAHRRIDKILASKTVRATAPYTWQVVVDAKIR
jgi:tRNA (guanine37-N1)-methyltransferase